MKPTSAHARLLIVGAWAALFAVLWATSSSSRYLGVRTQWLVPLGAVTLGAATVIGLVGARHADRLRVGEALGLFAMLVPLAGVLLVPHAELGAFAAAHKSSAFFPAVEPKPPATPRDVTLLDIKIAERDEMFALVSHIHPGTRIDLAGVVTRLAPGRFALTRFFITCCIADAQPLSIIVRSPHAVELDRWVRAVGSLTRDGPHLALVADRVSAIERPSDPYLTFSSG